MFSWATSSTVTTLVYAVDEVTTIPMHTHVTESHQELGINTSFFECQQYAMTKIGIRRASHGRQDLARVHDVERIKDLLDFPHPLYTGIILRVSERARLH